MQNRKDEAFAKLVIEMEIVSASVIRECMAELEDRKSKGETKLNLGILLIQKQLIKADDLKLIMEKRNEKKAQKPDLLKCQQCGKAFHVIGFDKNKTYKCNKCEGPLYLVQKQMKCEPDKVESIKTPEITDPFSESTPPKSEKVKPPELAPSNRVPLQHIKAPEDPLLGKQFGSYVIRKLIGKGGMGKVYLGENPMLNRFSAIKVLAPNFAKDEQYLKRFFREAKMAAKLQHPNIVAVYDFGQEYCLNYLVMEYVDGETLEDKIMREKKIPIIETLKMHIDVLDGLKAAHQQEIIHRDIKPENIMITKDGKIKLTDMGLARHQDPTQSEALTLEGQALGTPRFMAPEQALGEPIDPRTDLYALGVSVYHCITGNFPYDGRKPVEILKNMLRLDPTPLNSKETTVNSQLNNVIMKLLCKTKEDRYSDADTACEALKSCLRDYEGEKPNPENVPEIRKIDDSDVITDADMLLTPPQSVIKIKNGKTTSSNHLRQVPAKNHSNKPKRKRQSQQFKNKISNRLRKTQEQKTSSLTVTVIVILVFLLIALSLIIVYLITQGPQSSHLTPNETDKIINDPEIPESTYDECL